MLRLSACRPRAAAGRRTPLPPDSRALLADLRPAGRPSASRAARAPPRCAAGESPPLRPLAPQLVALRWKTSGSAGRAVMVAASGAGTPPVDANTPPEWMKKVPLLRQVPDYQLVRISLLVNCALVALVGFVALSNFFTANEKLWAKWVGITQALLKNAPAAAWASYKQAVTAHPWATSMTISGGTSTALHPVFTATRPSIGRTQTRAGICSRGGATATQSSQHWITPLHSLRPHTARAPSSP